MEIIDTRESKGIVKDYSIANSGVNEKIQDPLVEYQVLLDMFKNDAVLSTAIDTTVDVATFNGYSFHGQDKRKVSELQRLFDDELDFDLVLDNLFYQLLIHGDAFLELRRFDGIIKELHPLETTEMAIKYDENGRIFGYVQRPRHYPQRTVPFQAEDVIHFRLKWIGSQIYSHTPFESIARAYGLKLKTVNYISSLYENLPPSILWILKNANKEQKDDFLETLTICKNNPTKDLVTFGEALAQEIGLKNFGDGLLRVLEYLRTEILMITRVPPLWIGVLDNTNRSNTEGQILSFETKVKKIQQKVESYINKFLLPALGYKNIKFKFNAFSLTDLKLIVENAVNLKAIGYSPLVIDSFLRGMGVNLEHGEIPDHIEKMEEKMQKEAEAVPGKTDNMFPSRKPEDKKSKMKSNLDKKGVSKEGKEKLNIRSSTFKQTVFPKKNWSI